MTRSEEKRAQIIEAATKLFMKSGYGAVSMDAIAARANVSKRTVYGHFADKATLFIAIMDGYCAGIGGTKVLEDKDDGRVDLDDDIAAGLPDEAQMLTRYCDRTGRSGIDDWPVFLAFACFRSAAIGQGVAARAAQGNVSTASADPALVGWRARRVAECGALIARQMDGQRTEV